MGKMTGPENPRSAQTNVWYESVGQSAEESPIKSPKPGQRRKQKQTAPILRAKLLGSEGTIDTISDEDRQGPEQEWK